MEKLPMCRVCLAQNVRMHVIVNKNLHTLYEKLTDNPFVTEDRRPMLACFFCYAKMKQYYQFQRKCLEAEELFAQMINENYEVKPFTYQSPFECFNGFIQTPVVHQSIVDVCQTERVAVKEELPVVYERPDVIIEPKKEYHSDDLELKHADNRYSDVEDTPAHRYSESDTEDDVPLMEIKIEVDEEQEVLSKKPRPSDTQRSDTDSEYESGAPGPSTKKELRTEIVHNKCVTTYSSQDFKPSETHSTDNELRRGSPLQIIGGIVIEHDNNQMEVDGEKPTKDHVQKPRQIIGVRLNEAPKTSAERGREFRARKALLKQQSKQQQEPDAIVEIATEDIRSAVRSEIRTIEKRAKSAEATRRWRERKKGVSESSKKQAKTAAQRMREYRERKKIKENTVQAAK